MTNELNREAMNRDEFIRKVSETRTSDEGFAGERGATLDAIIRDARLLSLRPATDEVRENKDLAQPGDLASADAATTARSIGRDEAATRATTAALYMALAHCQGGHSDAGKAGAIALGITWPFNTRMLIKAARADGFNPAALYPWLLSAPYSGGRYFTGFEKSNARRVRGPA